MTYYHITYGLGEPKQQVVCSSEVAKEIWEGYQGSHALPQFYWNQRPATEEERKTASS